jgi:hypothetical protein
VAIWNTDIETIYVKYISNDVTYGLNLGLYPENYCSALGAHLALRSALPITRDKVTRNDLIALKREALATSRRLDAVDESVKSKPVGRLVGTRLWIGVRPSFANGKIRF